MIPYQELVNKKFSIGEIIYEKTIERASIEWVETFASRFIGRTVIVATDILDQDGVAHLREDNWKPYSEVTVRGIDGIDLTGALHKMRGSGGKTCPLVRFRVGNEKYVEWALRAGSHEVFATKTAYARYAKASKKLCHDFFTRQLLYITNEANSLAETYNNNLKWFKKNYEDLGLDDDLCRRMLKSLPKRVAFELSKLDGIKVEVNPA